LCDVNNREWRQEFSLYIKGNASSLIVMTYRM